MKRRLLIFSLILATMMAVPAFVYASEIAMPGIEQLADEEISIVVNGQNVTITCGQGQTLEVVSLTGRRVMTVKIESHVQKIELNIPKGCYILKIGKVVRKVSIL
jgi:hypothetical protein